MGNRRGVPGPSGNITIDTRPYGYKPGHFYRRQNKRVERGHRCCNRNGSTLFYYNTPTGNFVRLIQRQRNSRKCIQGYPPCSRRPYCGTDHLPLQSGKDKYLHGRYPHNIGFTDSLSQPLPYMAHNCRSHIRDGASVYIFKK